MPTPAPARSTLLFAALCSVVAGCSGSDVADPAVPESPTPSPDPRAEPHIEDAQAELDKAERWIDQIVGPGGAEAMKEGAQPGDDATTDEEERAGACDTACRALGAMERAKNHLCELAGDRDSRCEAAKDRVQRAGDRVRASCGGCHAA